MVVVVVPVVPVVAGPVSPNQRPGCESTILQPSRAPGRP